MADTKCCPMSFGAGEACGEKHYLCIGDRCMWYDTESDMCAVLNLALNLQDMSASIREENNAKKNERVLAERRSKLNFD